MPDSIGKTGGKTVANNFYSTISLATSFDYGHNWPDYAAVPSHFTFYPLPGQNPSRGPFAALGALGNSVCIGNDCSTPPPAN